MNVGELKAMLEGHDDAHEVMIAHQPSWPLAEVLEGVVADADRDLTAEEWEEAGEPDTLNVVWLVAGGHNDERSPYAPRDLFQGF